MFSTQDLILILIVALFLFGPTKLTEIARSLGKAAGEYKKTQLEVDYENTSKDRDDKIRIEFGIDIKNKPSEKLLKK